MLSTQVLRTKPYLEVKRNEGEYKSLEVLHEIVEHTQTFRICGLSHVD